MIKNIKNTFLNIFLLLSCNVFAGQKKVELKESLFKSPLVDLNYVEIKNSFSPMLLIHGYASKWQGFESIIPILGERKNVYALDLRGHGKSGRVPDKYKIQDYVDDIKSFTQECIKAKTIIYGHSLGGMIAIMVAAQHPELVKAIILEDPPLSLRNLSDHIRSHCVMLRHWRDLAYLKDLRSVMDGLKSMPAPNLKRHDLKKHMRKIAINVHDEKNPWFQQFARNIMEYDPDMLTSMIDNFDKTFEEYKIEELLPKIECPVLILRGEKKHGSLVSESDVASALKLLKKGFDIKVPGSGHSIFNNNRDLVLRSINIFLARLGS